MIRVVAAYPVVHIGNVQKNCDEILKLSKEWENNNVDIAVFPELCLTGYTCADLFHQSQLIEDALSGLEYLTKKIKSTIIVGLPVSVNGSLYNCAAVIDQNKVIGIVPKTFLPNYKEFYEKRWFQTPQSTDSHYVNINGKSIPFGTDILFSAANFPEFKFGVEVCEDAWMPIPPASFQAIAGATLIFNLSASNDTVTKSDYRREMIKQASGRYISGYVYCSSGPTESTADVVFGGHCIIAENGSLLIETKRFKNQDWIMSDIDIEKLLNSRRSAPTFADSRRYLNKGFITHNCSSSITNDTIIRKVDPLPFVQSNLETLKSRCEEIFNIQVCALAKRLQQVGKTNFSIGISGGLDSTLAALVVHKTFKELDWDTKLVNAITMPGFGTSSKTLNNSLKLMDQLGFTASTVDIQELCIKTFKDINHRPFGIYPTSNWDHGQIIEDGCRFIDKLQKIPTGSKDVTFENVQARIRTLILMSKGFVFGTGDMSELALGWCTYNGDHMSMYNVNCSIPKTLVKFLVKYIAENEVPDALNKTLMDIYETTISPELLPLNQDGTISQSTEDLIGPYELHDFFLFYFAKNGFKPDKILALAKLAFTYEEDIIKKWLKVFLTRFFAMQFKRECVPNGPKVGSVSLSPRGDWRCPSETDCESWLNF